MTHTTMSTMKRLLSLVTLVGLLVAGVFSLRPSAQVSVTLLQGALPTTTLSTAIPAAAGQVFGSSQSTILVASINVGSPNQFLVGNYLLIDQEVLRITSVPSSATLPVGVARGQMGTTAVSHASGSTVYVAPGYGFQTIDPPIGSCTSGTGLTSPWINAKTGAVWTCDASVWHNVSDAYLTVPASACVSSVSGNSTGTNGLTTAGASNTPVMQAQTSVTGTNTHTYVCTLPVPSRVNSTRGAYLMDVTFYYGVQGGALGTQAASLSAGTINSTTVFSSIAMPAAGASETASTVAPVRADAGSLTITPAVASWNTATTTAGAFYSAKFAPATPFAIATDLTPYLFAVTLQNAATTATTTNTPGLTVHYRYLSEGHVAR